MKFLSEFINQADVPYRSLLFLPAVPPYLDSHHQQATQAALAPLDELELIMKYALFAALSMFSLFASANGDGAPVGKPTAQAEQYDYTQDLDIAKVVRISNASKPDKACGPVKAKMEYIDSKGMTHQLEYTFLGGGCQNG